MKLTTVLFTLVAMGCLVGCGPSESFETREQVEQTETEVKASESEPAEPEK